MEGARRAPGWRPPSPARPACRAERRRHRWEQSPGERRGSGCQATRVCGEQQASGTGLNQARAAPKGGMTGHPHTQGLPAPPGQSPHLHLDLLGGGRQVGGHKPVPRGWVGDVHRGVVQQHGAQQSPDLEGGLPDGVVGEAGAQWVDDGRGSMAEVPRGRRTGHGSEARCGALVRWGCWGKMGGWAPTR